MHSKLVLVGASGYNYPEWRGTFYPEKFSTDKMLAFSAEALPHSRDQLHVLPDAERKAAERVGGGHPGWVLVHLEGAAPDYARLEAAALRRAAASPSAGSRRRSGRSSQNYSIPAAADVQKESGRPAHLAELLPDGTRAAFEFRHASWLDADIFDILRSRNLALCIADSEKMSTPWR